MAIMIIFLRLKYFLCCLLWTFCPTNKSPIQHRLVGRQKKRFCHHYELYLMRDSQSTNKWDRIQLKNSFCKFVSMSRYFLLHLPKSLQFNAGFSCAGSRAPCSTGWPVGAGQPSRICRSHQETTQRSNSEGAVWEHRPDANFDKKPAEG
jgi:hypothetical protein